MSQLTEEQHDQLTVRCSCGQRVPRAEIEAVLAGRDKVALLDSDSQAADYARPTGWQSATQRADPRVVTIHFENRECAEAFIKGLKPADGPITTATAMRDKCVEKVKVVGDEVLAELAAEFKPDGSSFSVLKREAVIKLLRRLRPALQSLTLDQVEPGEM